MRKGYTRFWFMGAYSYTLAAGPNFVTVHRPHGFRGPLMKQGFRVDQYNGDGKLMNHTYQGTLQGAKKIGRQFLGLSEA